MLRFWRKRTSQPQEAKNVTLRDEMHHVVDTLFDRFEADPPAPPVADVPPSDHAPPVEAPADPGPNTEPIGEPDEQKLELAPSAPPAVQSDLNALPVQEGQGQPEPGSFG
jgi:hypothetical protein